MTDTRTDAPLVALVVSRLVATSQTTGWLDLRYAPRPPWPAGDVKTDVRLPRTPSS